MSAGVNTWPRVGALRSGPRRQMEPEDVPIGSWVRTPTGQLAKVIGLRGFKRDHRTRLVCRYVQPANKRFDVVLLVPELVTIVSTATQLADAKSVQTERPA